MTSGPDGSTGTPALILTDAALLADHVPDGGGVLDFVLERGLHWLVGSHSLNGSESKALEFDAPLLKQSYPSRHVNGRKG